MTSPFHSTPLQRTSEASTFFPGSPASRQARSHGRATPQPPSDTPEPPPADDSHRRGVFPSLRGRGVPSRPLSVLKRCESDTQALLGGDEWAFRRRSASNASVVGGGGDGGESGSDWEEQSDRLAATVSTPSGRKIRSVHLRDVSGGGWSPRRRKTVTGSSADKCLFLARAASARGSSHGAAIDSPGMWPAPLSSPSTTPKGANILPPFVASDGDDVSEDECDDGQEDTDGWNDREAGRRDGGGLRHRATSSPPHPKSKLSRRANKSFLRIDTELSDGDVNRASRRPKTPSVERGPSSTGPPSTPPASSAAVPDAPPASEPSTDEPAPVPMPTPAPVYDHPDASRPEVRGFLERRYIESGVAVLSALQQGFVSHVVASHMPPASSVSGRSSSHGAEDYATVVQHTQTTGGGQQRTDDATQDILPPTVGARLGAWVKELEDLYDEWRKHYGKGRAVAFVKEALKQHTQFVQRLEEDIGPEDSVSRNQSHNPSPLRQAASFTHAHSHSPSKSRKIPNKPASPIRTTQDQPQPSSSTSLSALSLVPPPPPPLVVAALSPVNESELERHSSPMASATATADATAVRLEGPVEVTGGEERGTEEAERADDGHGVEDVTKGGRECHEGVEGMAFQPSPTWAESALRRQRRGWAEGSLMGGEELDSLSLSRSSEFRGPHSGGNTQVTPERPAARLKQPGHFDWSEHMHHDSAKSFGSISLDSRLPMPYDSDSLHSGELPPAQPSAPSSHISGPSDLPGPRILEWARAQDARRGIPSTISEVTPPPSEDGGGTQAHTRSERIEPPPGFEDVPPEPPRPTSAPPLLLSFLLTDEEDRSRLHPEVQAPAAVAERSKDRERERVGTPTWRRITIADATPQTVRRLGASSSSQRPEQSPDSNGTGSSRPSSDRTNSQLKPLDVSPLRRPHELTAAHLQSIPPPPHPTLSPPAGPTAEPLPSQHEQMGADEGLHDPFSFSGLGSDGEEDGRDGYGDHDGDGVWERRQVLSARRAFEDEREGEREGEEERLPFGFCQPPKPLTSSRPPRVPTSTTDSMRMGAMGGRMLRDDYRDLGGEAGGPANEFHSPIPSSKAASFWSPDHRLFPVQSGPVSPHHHLPQQPHHDYHSYGMTTEPSLSVHPRPQSPPHINGAHSGQLHGPSAAMMGSQHHHQEQQQQQHPTEMAMTMDQYLVGQMEPGSVTRMLANERRYHNSTTTNTTAPSMNPDDDYPEVTDTSPPRPRAGASVSAGGPRILTLSPPAAGPGGRRGARGGGMGRGAAGHGGSASMPSTPHGGDWVSFHVGAAPEETVLLPPAEYVTLDDFNALIKGRFSEEQFEGMVVMLRDMALFNDQSASRYLQHILRRQDARDLRMRIIEHVMHPPLFAMLSRHRHFHYLVREVLRSRLTSPATIRNTLLSPRLTARIDRKERKRRANSQQQPLAEMIFSICSNAAGTYCMQDAFERMTPHDRQDLIGKLLAHGDDTIARICACKAGSYWIDTVLYCHGKDDFRAPPEFFRSIFTRLLMVVRESHLEDPARRSAWVSERFLPTSVRTISNFLAADGRHPLHSHSSGTTHEGSSHGNHDNDKRLTQRLTLDADSRRLVRRLFNCELSSLLRHGVLFPYGVHLVAIALTSCAPPEEGSEVSEEDAQFRATLERSLRDALSSRETYFWPTLQRGWDTALVQLLQCEPAVRRGVVRRVWAESGDARRDFSHHYEWSYEFGPARTTRGGELLRLAQQVVSEMVDAHEPVPPHLASDLQAALQRYNTLPGIATTPHTASGSSSSSRGGRGHRGRVSTPRGRGRARGWTRARGGGGE
ncbi:unnamed protein product [Vitrella brassicaformis CCMP3155]|uniref:Uncharacterized protein n=3 Tax=Vitrella brassicaformis TaxID=1169539 RepID=A0A0G4ES70_VITBC|nr:unnamed protein product [Vitrella brassicaformis CCMP3155]|eukprot:CEM00752.1 unnamed protein product [Vitrella brassicaformis CCMP3155]